MNRKILITNDDGIGSNGIIRLAAAAVKYGEVWVVAPESQRSAASHSITLREHIDVYPHPFPVDGVKAFAVSGTPADCARLGILSIMPKKPDIVLSGINFGYNAGGDVQYSATVGAAMEAVFQGVPAVALSEGTNDGYIITDMYLDEILSQVINSPFTPQSIVNVNFPNCTPEDFKGILRSRASAPTGVFSDGYIGEPLANGGTRYRVNGSYIGSAPEDSDLYALYNNYISIGTITNIH